MADRAELQKEIAVLKSDMGEIREHLATLVQTMKEVAKAEGGEAKARIEAETQSLAERLKTAVEEARGQGRRAYATLEQHIEERPIVSLAAAFGIGLLLGKLLDWRR